MCAGLVPESQHDRYDYAVSSTRSLLNSTVVEIAAAVLAYAIVAALVLTKPINEVLGWHGGVSNGQLKVTPASRCRSA